MSAVGGSAIRIPGLEFEGSGPSGPFRETVDGFNFDPCLEEHPPQVGSPVINLTQVLFPSDGPNIWAHLPDATFDARVPHFLDTPVVLSATYYIMPIDGEKYAQQGGRKGVKYDVPNLTFACVAFLLKNKRNDLVVVDPVAPLAHMYRGNNLTRVMNQIVVASSPSSSSDWAALLSADAGGVVLVNYQANGGDLKKPAQQAIEQIVSPHGERTEFLRVELAPGKYTDDGVGIDPACRRDFAKSVGMLALYLMRYPAFLRALGYPAVASLNFVLDEFAGYAMHLPAILMGLGIDGHCRVLCKRGASYRVMPACARSVKQAPPPRPELETE